MRLSLEPGDPGFICISKAGDYAVYFNGERLDHVITADEEHGYVRCYVLRAGKLSVCGDQIETSDFFGTVRIESIRL